MELLLRARGGALLFLGDSEEMSVPGRNVVIYQVIPSLHHHIKHEYEQLPPVPTTHPLILRFLSQK